MQKKQIEFNAFTTILQKEGEKYEKEKEILNNVNRFYISREDVIQQYDTIPQ